MIEKLQIIGEEMYWSRKLCGAGQFFLREIYELRDRYFPSACFLADIRMNFSATATMMTEMEKAKGDEWEMTDEARSPDISISAQETPFFSHSSCQD